MEDGICSSGLKQNERLLWDQIDLSGTSNVRRSTYMSIDDKTWELEIVNHSTVKYHIDYTMGTQGNIEKITSSKVAPFLLNMGPT